MSLDTAKVCFDVVPLIGVEISCVVVGTDNKLIIL